MSYLTVQVGGLKTASVTMAQMGQIMVEDCRAARDGGTIPKLVFSANGHSVSMYGLDKNFAKLLDEADMVHADGMSVVFASRLFNKDPLPERTATTDFFHVAAAAAQEEGLRFYMLGGSENNNLEAVKRARQLYPNLNIVGRRNGYFKQDDEPRICEEIRDLKTDVLWLALGRPKQEGFAVRRREELGGVGWVKTCGGLFDFLAGERSRAPSWCQSAGLEWTWRLSQDPQRLFWRYATTNVHAAWRYAIHSRRS